MSMSQEEIESLMNGLDFKDDEASSEAEEEKAESQDNMSEDDINQLIAQTGDVSKEEETKGATEDSVDDILNSLENVEAPQEETNIDDIVKELEGSEIAADEKKEEETEEPENSLENSTEKIDEVTSNEDEDSTEKIDEASSNEDKDNKEKIVQEIGEAASNEDEESNEPTIEETIAASNEQVSTDNIDELLSSIDGVVDEGEETTIKEENIDLDGKTRDDLDHKINSGVFPFPVEEDTKVVSQLSAVANDSEEKASKIFDAIK